MDSNEPIEDYESLFKIFHKNADYITLNVSSPNTPDLRDLQKKYNLEKLIETISKHKKNNSIKTPVFLKIDPDMPEVEYNDIADIVLSYSIDGVIISNTSTYRPNELISKKSYIEGGLSGVPIKERSNKVLKKFYNLTQGKIPLIGVGGISNGKDAYERILNGASLIQLYTSLVYQGPSIVNDIKKELIYLLKKNNYKTVSQAVGKLNK